MARRIMLGPKIRRLRREQSLSQVELAKRLGISASYLNLIEHNQRALTVPLLFKLGSVLNVELQLLSDDDESQLLADLVEIAGDPLFQEFEFTQNDMSELTATSPTACQALSKLYRTYRRARDNVQHLSERLSQDPFLTATTHQLRTLLTSIRSFAEILHDNVDLAAAKRQQFLSIVVDESENLTQTVNHLLNFITDEGLDRLLVPDTPHEQVTDFLQARRNYFDDLEAAAEAFLAAARLERGDAYRRLAQYLADHQGITVAIEPAEHAAGALSREDAEAGRLVLSELLPPSGRTFELARRIGHAVAAGQIEPYLDDPRLTSAASRALCREVLAKYFAAAVLMPYEPFRAAAQALRYDIDLLSRRFGASFEQVCHRLSTLNRPGAQGIPFHFLRVDIAGNVSKRFSGSGFRIPRFGGVCPRWNVHAAFMTPGKIDVQVSETPDGGAYFCLARTVTKPAGAVGEPRSHFAVSIGCEVVYARELVYADGVDIASATLRVPVGTSCRACPRTDCTQRAHPTLIQPPETQPAAPA